MNVIDLFCGGGGFGAGFKKAGFKIVAAVDNFKPVAETYKANFPETEVIVEDIKRLKTDYFKKFNIDVVIGSPPCEPFTPINMKRYKDPLDRLYVDSIGRLVLEFIRFVADLQPKIFVMENVVQVAEGELRDALAYEFERIGYKPYFNILKAEDYGIPSRRTRIFISNIKLKLKKEKRRVTVYDAIKDLPDPREPHNIPNHVYRPLPKRIKKKVHRLRYGQAAVYFGYGKRRFSDYQRLDPNRPAPTIRGSSRFIHPFEDRLITVREQARLMSFPDNHVFKGGFDIQYNQVGEAVPPKLSYLIALKVKVKLNS